LPSYFGRSTACDDRENLMSKLERFKNVVLGGGEAGKYIAWELARGDQPRRRD
jgi:hypothetical protein